MRIYFKLLRLCYQLQLGPIFAWGFLLGGGKLASSTEIARFVGLFLIFHIGAFGGMTALNSFYDRDETPIGGMWNPPKIPPKLGQFAWLIQLGGLAFMLPFGAILCAIYTALLLLSWLYSHPKPRGKGRPFASLVIVSVGQGVLDCLAGAFSANAFSANAFSANAFSANAFLTGNFTISSTRFGAAFVLGMLGATLTVAAFYPLTQLYQAQEDSARGDRTLALWLLARGSRSSVFAWSLVLGALGIGCNVLALWKFGWPRDAFFLLVAGVLPLGFIANWKSSTRNVAPDTKTDFLRVHFLMRAMAISFGSYILLRLVIAA